jgi:hypothetical protein
MAAGSATTVEVQRQFTSAFTSIVADAAKMSGQTGVSLIELQQVFGSAFSQIGQTGVNNLLAIMDAGGEMADNLIKALLSIAASSEDAGAKIAEVAAMLNNLPTQKNIFINLIPRWSGAVHGGNQQGEQWDFTLEGEDFATRDAFMKKYGDYGRANQAWEEQHRAELLAKGYQPPVPKAFGMHETVTRPTLMMVGERGPEQVDVSPSGGGRRPDGATITINSMLPPSEYQLQMMARQLKKYMRN